MNLNKGSKQTQAFSKAIDAAKNVMMDAGCPLDICDLLADAAINGYKTFVLKNLYNTHLEEKPTRRSNGDPMNLLMTLWTENKKILKIYFCQNIN